MSVATDAMLRERVLLRFGPHIRLTLLHIDLAVITLWFGVTSFRFQYNELLLYPMTLYFIWGLVRDRQATWPVFKCSFVLLLLPTWWLLSIFWSPEPAAALKTGLMVILTILICMFMASRLDRRQLLLVILTAKAFLAIRCVLETSALNDLFTGQAAKGIYKHKNSLGSEMSVLWIVSLAIFLMPSIPWMMRRAALAIGLIAILLVFASRSGTAIVVTIGMSGIVLGAQVYFGNYNILTLPRVVLLALTVAGTAIGLALIINISPVDDPVAMALEALGKDRSLSGRTDLWAIAMNEISERPLFGTGAKGFWRYEDSPLVREIFFDYNLSSRSKFHFHNSWLDLSVNLGLIGVVLAAVAVIWASLLIGRNSIVHGGSENWVFLAILFAALARTLTEAELFAPFSNVYMLLWTGAIMAAMSQKHTRYSFPG